jgi:hypothetical protein
MPRKHFLQLRPRKPTVQPARELGSQFAEFTAPSVAVVTQLGEAMNCAIPTPEPLAKRCPNPWIASEVFP